MKDTELLDSMIYGRVEPYIYAFETNTVPNFLKVGDTYRPVEVRLDEWRKFYSDLQKKYERVAKVDEKTYFRDYAVHDFLMKHGFRRIEESDIPQNFYISKEFFKGAQAKDVDEAISDIQESFDNKDNRYLFYDVEDRLSLGELDFERNADWEPRENQEKVAENFVKAVKAGRKNLLMFAVMRFGKSFTSLYCAKKMKAKLVVVCGKTAVRSEWKENVQRPQIFDGFYFADSSSMMRDPKIVSEQLSQGKTVVVFLTLQDLLGENIKNRHKDLFTLNKCGKIDLLIIDETHFGARAEELGKVLNDKNDKKNEKQKQSINKQEKEKGYDESFDELEQSIKVFSPKVKLHLSGTPYRILLDNEFGKDDIIGTVQYSDIMDAKEKWDHDNIDEDEWENPYYGFPQMIRFAFDLNESAKAKLENLKNNGYRYDLNELLSPKSTSKSNSERRQFKYRNEVLDLLRAIDGCKEDENIFSFLNYDKIKTGKMCRHIVMVLPYCASCDAMEILLKTEKFNNLNDYEIINIAGFDSGKIFSRADYASKVKEKIEKCESEGKKTISLTVGKMLTGCTVKEWDTMIFLRNTASPQDYDQAIFRLQSQYVKTIKHDDSKIIKHDMKPQTLLVDFDPVRMYVLQHKKSLIANINKEKRGNDILEEKLERELQISPIIFINHNKLQKVEAQDIVDCIRKYNADKSMMDETFDIEVDERIFEDEEIKDIISHQPEITGSGLNFEMSPHKSDGDGTSIDAPDSSSEPQKTETQEKKSKQENEEDERKKLIKKLQGYYFRLLLFAFLSEQEEKTISDIINHIEKTPDGKRIGANLQIDAKELELIREKINPAILSYLENKIENINQLGKEAAQGTIETALRKMSRLSSSEIVTPDKVATELVENLPDDITAKSKILDIASKTGEFANALVKKYGAGIKNNVYSIPTSPVTYECTRKIYKILGMPVKHIYDTFTSYDLIDKNKNKELIKELSKMKFKAIIGNPPYTINVGIKKDNYGIPLYNEFILNAIKLVTSYVSMITPSKWFTGGRGLNDFRTEMLNDSRLKFIKDFTDSQDCFPGVDVPGGVNYFLWDYKYNGLCSFTNITNGKISTLLRNLSDLEILTRYNEAITILSKIKQITTKYLSEIVASTTPFGFITTFRGQSENFANAIKLKTSGGDTYVSRSEVKRSQNMIDQYKVYISKATCEHTGVPDKNGQFKVVSSNGILKPNEICTQSYIVVGNFDDEVQAKNLHAYIKTKLFRTLMLLALTSQDISKEKFCFVPLQDFTDKSDIDWSKSVKEIDQQLYKKYGLSKEEIDFIESKVKEME